MFFSFYTFFSVTYHISHHTVCISHFLPFSVFLAIIQVKQCLCLFFFFSNFLTIILVLQSIFLIFHVFECFLPYFMFYSVCFSFAKFSRFLAIFQVLQCAFLIFHLFQCFLPYCRSYHVYVPFSTIFHFSRHNPGPRVCFSHFPPFSVFPTIFHIIQCVVLIFQNFQFLAYSRSYSVHFSFSTFFSVSRHNAGPTVYFSHFSRFSVLLAIFHIIQCAFLIFHLFTRFSHFCPFLHVFQVSCHIPCPTMWISYFSRLSVFLAIILVLQCVFLIF